MSYGSDVGRIMRSGLRHWPKVTLVALVTLDADKDGAVTLAKLCAMLDAGRTVVRDAIAELTASGIVSISQRPGAPSTFGVDLEAVPAHDPSATRTPPSGGPLRHADDPPPSGGPLPSATRTPPLRHADGSTSNRIEHARARSCPSSDLSLTNNPPTPQGEGEDGYYSAKGGNRPAPVEVPPSQPEPEVEQSPVPGVTAAQFRAALLRIEQRLIDCIPVTPRRGKPMTLGAEALRVISALLVQYGPVVLEERIGRCAGMEIPIRALQADLAKDPPKRPQVRQVTQPPPGPRPEQSETDRLRGLVLLTRTVIEDLERKCAEDGGLSGIDAKRLEKLRGDLPGYVAKLEAAEAAEVGAA